MPEPTQYLLTHQEAVTAIIKDIGLNEGKWQLVVHFGFAAINIGPKGEEAPSGLVSVLKLGVQRADTDVPVHLTVDAAEVNPAPEKSRGRGKAQKGVD